MTPDETPVQLCIETSGDPDDPALLLLGGAASSMDWWDDDLVDRLAAAGRFVVRYDTRDTGQSAHWPPGEPGYGFDDLVSDAVAVLDALGIDRAHVLGVSMGGVIAQVLGVRAPDRILSLTLVATTPGGDDLPGPERAVTDQFDEPAPDPDLTDRDAVVAMFLDGERRLSGTIPVDENRIRTIAGRAFDRTLDVGAMLTNHFVLDGGDDVRPLLGTITAPTLVLHGTLDPMFPFRHAEVLAAEIPGATLVPLDGMGHQYPPPPMWDRVVDAVETHTRS